MFQHWSYDESTNRYYGAFQVVDKLAAGMYYLNTSHEGIPIARGFSNLRTDKMATFTHGPSLLVASEIARFWDSSGDYHYYNAAHKRGILLHGPAGCGKTGIISTCIQQHIERGGIVFTVHDAEVFRGPMTLLRQIEKDRPVLVVMEDLESVINADEEELLELMDGSSSVADNILFLATTNNLKAIPTRIRSRPSRIDTLIEVGFPDTDQRYEYLLFLMQRDPEREAMAAGWASETKDFSLAMLKELVLSVRIYNKTLEEAIALLREIAEEGE